MFNKQAKYSCINFEINTMKPAIPNKKKKKLFSQLSEANTEFQKKYLDQALKVLNPKEPPAVERIYNYSIARKVNTELDAAGWKPGK